MTGRRYPLDPVLRRFPDDRLCRSDPSPVYRLADAISGPLGLSHKAARARVHRGLRDGLNERQADELATALGLHPTELWSDYGAERQEVSA